MEMVVRMLRQGKTLVAIGSHFGKVHTTILYLMKKNGITRTEKAVRTTKTRNVFAITQPTNANKYDDIFFEPINRGKSYKEYLKEQELRQTVTR